MFSWFSRFRRVRRIESEGVHDFDMRFTLHAFPDARFTPFAPPPMRIG